MKTNLIEKRECQKCFIDYDGCCDCPDTKDLWLGLCDCVCDKGVCFPGAKGLSVDESFKWDELRREQKEAIENFVGITHFLDDKQPLIDFSGLAEAKIIIILDDSKYLKKLTVIDGEKVVATLVEVDPKRLRREFMNRLWKEIVKQGRVDE